MGTLAKSSVNSNTKNNGTTGIHDPFSLVPTSEIYSVLKTLEARLPASCQVYNCAHYLSRHPEEYSAFRLYVLNNNYNPSSAWFIATYTTQDHGDHISISEPIEFEVTSELKQAFIETNVIDWKSPQFMFCTIDRRVAEIIFNISVYIKGFSTRRNPNYHYYLEKEEALKLENDRDLSTTDNNIEDQSIICKPLDTEIGAKFITSLWKYTAPGTLEFAKDMIQKLPSSGVYINNSQVVSGAMTHPHFNIGMLATNPNYRGKGYASICMKALIKNLAEEGYIPCSAVEVKNEASNKFHLKCGMKLFRTCDYILVAKD